MLDEKDAFLQTWRTRSPTPAAPHRGAEGPGGGIRGGVRDPGAVSSNPLQPPSANRGAEEVTGICLCRWVMADTSILPEATRPVDAEACPKSVFPPAPRRARPGRAKRWAAVWDDALRGDRSATGGFLLASH